VRAHGSVTQSRLDEFRKGATIDGIHYGPIEATLDRVQGSNLWLALAIREGKNREVRNVLGDLGLTVARLIRVSFGPFQLGDLAEGAVEEVRTRVLREQLGERLVALSGADFSAPMAAPAPPEKSGATLGRAGQKPAGQKPATSKSPSHSWRAREDERPAKKLGRKFRGSRRDDGARAQEALGKPRVGLLTDRKGRRVLVERFQQESPAPPPQDRTRKPHRGPPRRRQRRSR
jgi:23S rRNA pseudouridine2605 synthase